MGSLDRRLAALEARSGRRDICPEHLPDPSRPTRIDYREGLQAFSPDPAERAAYHARQDALEAQPPCARCGWKPYVIRVHAVEHWGSS